MKKENIIVTILAIVFGATACSEQEIETYDASLSYIYFDKSATDSTEFSFAYEPGITTGVVSLKLNTITCLSGKDRGYAVQVVGEETTALEGRDYVIRTEDLVVKANDSIAYLNIEVMKNTALSGKSVRLVLELVPTGDFEPGLVKYRKARVVISDKLSRPVWWDSWHESSGLGTYSDKKYSLFIQQSGVYDLTLDTNGGKMDYYTMRGYVQLFKYWLKANPQTEEDGSEMTVPLVG